MVYRHVHIEIVVLPPPGIRELSFLPPEGEGVEGTDNSIKRWDHKESLGTAKN